MNHRDSTTPVDEAGLQQHLTAKGLNAPRVTPTDVDNAIVGESYHVFPSTTVTVCCLLLANGFTVTGESACASPENFDEQVGRDIARRNARDKVWGLLGYALRERLATPTPTRDPSTRSRLGDSEPNGVERRRQFETTGYQQPHETVPLAGSMYGAAGIGDSGHGCSDGGSSDSSSSCDSGGGGSAD